MHPSQNQNSPYIIFSKEEWSDLGFGATLNLTENEIIELRGLNEPMSIDEVRDVYLPISRLLNLYISCLLYTSPSPRDLSTSRMPSSA